MMNNIAVVSLILPSHMVAIQQKICTPLGSAIRVLAAV
jgi:hypothetical protein